jgi:DNA-3-methyladenine glycosylase
MPSPLPISFYQRDTVEVARNLLGARLVRLLNGTRLTGLIVEAEAYRGEEDQACHARSGRTPRTQVMYGPPGRAYVYFTYGMHWMLNCVTELEGFPAAVLLRAVRVEEGQGVVAARRARVAAAHWTDGPAKLCQAFGIDKALNGADLTTPADGLWIEPGVSFSEAEVIRGPRVGLGSTPEPWLSIPWRFRVRG